MRNYSSKQKELAQKIANDISEDINIEESEKDLLMAVRYYADAFYYERQDHQKTLDKAKVNLSTNFYRGAAERAEKIYRMNNSEMRLMCGELTSDEIRTIKAVLKHVLGI